VKFQGDSEERVIPTHWAQNVSEKKLELISNKKQRYFGRIL